MCERKRDALLGDLAQIAEAEDLKSAGIGKDGAVPAHEAVQPAQAPDRLVARPQVEMVGIAEEELNAQFFQQMLRDSLDRALGADRHEDRRLDRSVRERQSRPAPGAARFVDLKLQGHLMIVMRGLVLLARAPAELTGRSRLPWRIARIVVSTAVLRYTIR